MEKTIDEALEYLTDFDLYSPYQEAIDKVSAYIKQMQADYEIRLKADMVVMLTEILTDFDNQIEPNSTRIDCESIIEQKIQALKGKTDGEK